MHGDNTLHLRGGSNPPGKKLFTVSIFRKNTLKVRDACEKFLNIKHNFGPFHFLSKWVLNVL